MSKISILKDTAVYSVSTLIMQGLNVVLAIYIRRLLGPEAMGVWALLQIYLVYVAYFNLGVYGAVYREIPFLRGAGEEAKIESLKNSAFSYVTVSSTVASLLIVIGTFLFREKLSEPFFYGLLSLAVINLFQRANNFQIKILITDKNFSLISRFNVFSAIVNFGLTVSLVWFFKLYGLYLATLLSYFLNCVYLAAASNVKFRFQWKKDEVVGLIQFGLPLVGLGLVTKFFYSLDKLIIGKFLGLSELGVYTLATMALNYIVILPNMFHVVIYPRILERFGDEKDKEGQRKYSTMPVKFISLYFSFALGLIWIVAPYVCHLFLPKFAAGIPALKALIVGGCFLSLFEQMGTILLGYKRHLWTIPLMLLLSGIMFGVDVVLIQKKMDISVIAVVSSLIYFAAYIGSAIMALRPLFSLAKILGEMSGIVIPFLMSVVLLITLDWIWAVPTLFSLMAKMILYFGAIVFSLRFFDARFSLISLIQKAGREIRSQKESL